MTTNNEQNGRQPPLPNRPTLPSDPRVGNVSDQQKPLCRKYVWGTCTKSFHCKFRHDLDIEEMKKILKFCHDFQNKQGCGRVDCTYLHASKEEETLFRINNQIPQLLLERYAALAEASDSMNNFEGVPQMMMFVTAPPPPPPPPTQSISAAAAPPPPPPPQPAPVYPPIQQPPPPPPPPPTVPPTSQVQTAPIFTGPPPPQDSPMFPMGQPPPTLPPIFDASRPPPPLPDQAKQGGVKRRMECEAGPSKVRKPEVPKVAENPCEICVQRALRIDVYDKEADKIHCELKYQSFLYKKKLKEYETTKEILRAIVSKEFYRVLEDYVEDGPPQVQDILVQLSSNPVMSLLEYIFNARNTVDSAISPSLRLDDLPASLRLDDLPTSLRLDDLPTSLRLDDSLSSLSSMSRMATTPVNHSSSELLHTLVEFLRNSNSDREIRPDTDIRTSTSNSVNVNPNANGFNRFPNGQLAEVTSATASTSTNSSRVAATIASVTPRSYPTGVGPSGGGAGPSGGGAGPSGLPAAAPAPAPAPQASVFPPYHPGIPPPTTRPYYSGPVPSSTSMTNTPYNTARVGAPQMAVRPPVPSVPPSMPPSMPQSMPTSYSQYMMGRYPHPPQFYPPYQ